MNKTVRVLVAALGGEGGGVLQGWLVAAAQAQGLAVQATSVPGVAQRTGSTTYYIEMAEAPRNGAGPVFALMPVEGGIDLLVATELLEAARMVERGYVTPDRTFVLGSTYRMLTVPEKSARGDGTLSADALLKAVEARSRGRLIFDMTAVSRDQGVFVNSVVFGAIAGLGVLPIEEKNFRAALDGSKANERGFDAGFHIVAGKAQVPDTASHKRPAGDTVSDTIARRVAAMPEAARDIVRIGAARVEDYQGKAYAMRYLDRLEPFLETGPLLRDLARHLAVRMTYEDIIRVAQLKVRPERFDRIRTEIGADKDEPFEVVEFFRPGISEFADISLPVIGRRLRAWQAAKPSRHQLGFSMKVRTRTLNGFLRVWMLAKLRGLRPWTLRFHEEQEAIEAWLAMVQDALKRDAALARQVCDLARIVKGYGDTHARSLAAYGDIRERIVAPALAGKTDAGKAARELEKEIAHTLSTY